MSLETLLEAARFVEQQDQRAAQLRANTAVCAAQPVLAPQPAPQHTATVQPLTITQPKLIQGQYTINLADTIRMFNPS